MSNWWTPMTVRSLTLVVLIVSASAIWWQLYQQEQPTQDRPDDCLEDFYPRVEQARDGIPGNLQKSLVSRGRRMPRRCRSLRPPIRVCTPWRSCIICAKTKSDPRAKSRSLTAWTSFSGNM